MNRETTTGNSALCFVMTKVGRSFWVKCWLSRFRWYRKWYGGRWEYHWIDICHGALWLDMTRPRVWPLHRQPCSVGAPLIEDYPDNSDLTGNQKPEKEVEL
jgi:hypothetical protein